MKPEYIILHHSLTKDSVTVSWGAIRRYHTVELGWNDIGYHYGIELIDNNYEILLGRLPDQTGAHCKEQGMNNKSLGICLVGNFDVDPPPLQQWNKALAFVRHLCSLYNIPRDNIYGHRNFAPYKSCPGNSFDIQVFKNSI